MSAQPPPPPSSQSTTTTTTNEVSQQFTTLIVNAFSLVAALAWSEALSGAFEKIPFFKSVPTWGPFMYAGLVTLAAYFVAKSLSGYVKTPCTTLCTPPPTATATPAPATATPAPATPGP
jgi:hypothetical protein